VVIDEGEIIDIIDIDTKLIMESAAKEIMSDNPPYVHSAKHKQLFIIASRFEELTGGLVWTNKLAEYAKHTYQHTTVIDLSRHSSLFGNSRYFGMFYFLFYFFKKHDFFVFIDHRLHLRFNLPLLVMLICKRNRYATLCHHVLCRTKKNAIRRRIEFISEKLFLRYAQLIVVPSQRTMVEVARFGVSKQKIKVVNPTRVFTCDELPKRSLQRRLLFVGNLEERKGVDVLLRAVTRICDFSLDIVGDYKDGNYVRRLRAFVRENGLTGKVSFHGRIDTRLMPSFYRNANIFVFPSRHEGYGMVLVEAMCFGLPIVATSIPTTLEIVRHGVNGYVCPLDDEVCIAKSINRLLNDSGLQRRMSLRNFEMSCRFQDWDEVARDTFAAFKPYLGQ
jgi:glycosyltransferase involved in cell wall biosynthesis